MDCWLKHEALAERFCNSHIRSMETAGNVKWRMKRRSIFHIGGLMCFGVLAMVVLIIGLWLVLVENDRYQYQEQYPPANNFIPSPPNNISSFTINGFEVVNANMEMYFNFNKMHYEWDMLYSTLHKMLANKGLKGPSEKHCFLWVEDCYNLAKHPIIVNGLIPVLGPDVILYGIKLWKMTNGTSRSLHLDTESGECDEVANVAIGSKVRMLKGSQMYEDKWRHTLLNNIAVLDNHRNHANIEDIIVGTVRKGIFRKPGNSMEDVSFITIEPGEGNMVLFHGKAVYRIEDDASSGEVTPILQFASAKCKIRDSIQARSNVFLPPVLLISGIYDVLSTPNDVRTVMASDESQIFVPMTTKNLTTFAPAKKNFSYFSWKNLPTKCETNAGYRTCKYGSVSTAVLSRISFEYHVSEVGERAFRALASNDEEKVVIVLSGSLLYFCADMEVQGYREMSVLELHASTYIPVGGWHEVVPASPYGNTFITVHWRRRKTVTRKSWSGFRGYFGFQMIMLQSGQAYDPSNENNCDVILVMLYGKSLQMLPSEIFLEESQTLLISGGEPCLLWNIGKASTAFVAITVCDYDEQIEHLFNGDPSASSYFSIGGRIMR